MRHGDAHFTPGPVLGGSLLQHHGVDARNRAGGFRRGDEVTRRQHAALGMTPAHKRLGAFDFERMGRNLRLVENLELVFLQRHQQFVGDLLVGDRDVAQGGVENHGLVTAHALGFVERDPAIDEDVAHRLRFVIHPGDADARRNPNLMLAILQRFAKRADNVLRETGKPFDVAVPVRHQREFIAADTGQKIPRRGDGAQHVCCMTQHRIAGAVAKRIVDFLEPVEIDMQHGERRRDGRFLLALHESGFEVAAIGKLGQSVVKRVMAQNGLRAFQLPVLLQRLRIRALDVLVQPDVVGNIPVDADHMRATVDIPVEPAKDLEMADGAIVENDAEIAAEILLGGQKALKPFEFKLPVLRVQVTGPDFDAVSTAIGALAVKRVHALVPDCLTGFGIHVPDADARGFQRELHALRQLLEFRLAGAEHRDVAVALAHQLGDAEHEGDDQDADRIDQEMTGNALAQGLLPALPRDGGDRPVGVGERDRLRDRLPAEDGIAAGKDLGRCVVVCILADGHYEIRVEGGERFARKQAVDVDKSREDAPGFVFGAVVERIIGHQRIAALHQRYRSVDDGFAGQQRLFDGGHLIGAVRVVEADGLPVFGEGIDHFDGHVARECQAHQRRILSQQLAGEDLEPAGRNFRFERNRKSEPFRQRQVFADVARYPCTGESDLFRSLQAKIAGEVRIQRAVGEIHRGKHQRRGRKGQYVARDDAPSSGCGGFRRFCHAVPSILSGNKHRSCNADKMGL